MVFKGLEYREECWEHIRKTGWKAGMSPKCLRDKRNGVPRQENGAYLEDGEEKWDQEVTGHPKGGWEWGYGVEQKTAEQSLPLGRASKTGLRKKSLTGVQFSLEDGFKAIK